MSTYIAKNVAAMQAYTPGEQPQDRDLIKLNTNENPYPPSPRVALALAAFDSARLRLYPEPRNLALRRRVAAIHNCGEEQVFVGNGSDEILALATRAFVEDHGRIGYCVPSYSLYPVLAAIRNVATAPLELGPDFVWRQPEAYAADLFFLANPNAPTSLLMPGHAVREFCAGLDGVVLIDEAYVDFACTNCLALAAALPNVLVMRTLSKSYSLAGLRLGYVVGPRPLIAALYKIKDSYNVNRLTQRIAVAALSDQPHMRRNVARILATRQRLGDRLRQAGFTVFPSEANFLWVQPPVVPARDLFDRLKQEGVLVRHFAGPRTAAYLRVTVGSEGDVNRLLDTLRSIL